MRYEYTLIHRIFGVASQSASDLELASSTGFRALLAADIESHSRESDRSLALATMLLRGLFGGGPEGTFDERFAAGTATVAEERRRKHSSGPYLVIHVAGEVPNFEGRVERELDQFVIQLNGVPKDDIRAAAAPAVASAVAALSLVSQRELHLEKTSDVVMFYRDDGKPVYSFTTTGSANLTVASPLTEDRAHEVRRLFNAIAGAQSLERVIRLYVTSLQMRNDPLRGFLAAWTALEIFINKLFPSYEAELFTRLRAQSATQAYNAYLARISEVMRDKYRLADKFGVIAVQLVPSEADADLERFRAVKRLRDNLSHGQDTDEARLPVAVVQSLLKKYLSAHLAPAGAVPDSERLRTNERDA